MVERNIQSEWSLGFLPPRFISRRTMEKNGRFCCYGINYQGTFFSLGPKPNWGPGHLIVEDPISHTIRHTQKRTSPLKEWSRSQPTQETTIHAHSGIRTRDPQRLGGCSSFDHAATSIRYITLHKYIIRI